MNEHHRTLLDDLDEAPVGAAPVGHLLTGGQAAKRRKQRGFVAGAAAVTALVVGGSALALQGIPGGSDDRDSNAPLIADSAAPDLAVEVEVGVAKSLVALIDGQDGKVAIWNPGHRTLAFVPAMGYSSSCPPLGTAKFTDSGAVTLTVRTDPATDPCTADDQPVTVTIDGLTTAPPELTVNIQGETDAIPVKSLSDDQAPPDESSTSGPSEKGVRVAVPSHCGVVSLTVKGRLWLADPPLGDHNPPPGWDENETMGSFLQTGPRRAVFQGDKGQSASFRLAPLGAEDPNTGCE